MTGARRGGVRAAMAMVLVCGCVGLASGTVRAQPDPDEPFSQPQYLIHITGHGTTSGDVKDDALVLHPSEPDPNGNFLIADGSGGTIGYSSDYHSGPYATPAEVCAAAAGRPGGEFLSSFSGSAPSVDCVALAGGDTTTTTTDPASSTATLATVPSSTEPPATCTVRGNVTDYFGAPVPDIHISLRAGQVQLETSTLDDGSYQFPKIGDDPTSGFDPAAEPVTVALISEEWTHQPQRFVVYHRQRGASLRADPFLIGDNGDCRRDFDMRSIPSSYTSIGPPIDEWPDMTQIYQGIHRAWSLADMLDLHLTYGLPLQIRAFCDDASPPAPCSESKASFFGTKSSGSQIVDRPLISFGLSESRLLSLNWPDNREYHEFGHYVLASMLDGIPDRGADQNHGGYANSSSTDSWSEGFAEFWASMVVKYIDRRQRPDIYQWNQGHLLSNSPNAPPAPGSSLLDAWPARIDEEFAVASLLFTLESLDASEPPPAPREPRTLEITGYTEIAGTGTDPSQGRLIVGTVVNRTTNGASFGTIAGATFFDATGAIVDASYGSTIPANLAGNGGKGVIVLVVPDGINYTDLAVLSYEGSPPLPSTTVEPLDVSLDDIWAAIAAFQSTKPLSGGRLHDVEDLYAALKNAFGGRGTVVDGLDTIDQLFVERGLFDDSDGDGLYAPGDTIGRTSHPAYGDQELCAARIYLGCSPVRIPRTDYTGPAALTATVDIGLDDGTTDASQVYAHVSYPVGERERSYGYVLAPSPDGTVQLAVPPPGSGAIVTLVGIAPDHIPTILGTIAADTFWDEAMARKGEPFLTFRATLPAGEFELPTGEGDPPASAPTSTNPPDTTPSSSPSRNDGVGLGSVGIVAVGLVAAGALGWRRRPNGTLR
jgi:hypothetical protein